ncbi:hypothetical protein [Pectobacterium brasiliense]|uniref:hypothetical protein n=1 Tax=Pectobacterium brasiliense TaxID=180957 RepID=UPI000B200A71|nr:hypothetical protein [Pectobacterium brasiliense]
MKKNKRRINFKNGVPDILYRQAGGRCSVPRCKNPTMGPYYNHDGAINMGVACHIYSAAEDGPRGWGEKDADFISSEQNGLWCCAYHASLIDKSNGKDYSTGTLFAWKELAEARTRKQMNDTPSPSGWVDKIAVEKFSNNSIKPKITLSRWTLIYGNHGVGKTALLEFAASVSNSKYADRFMNNNDEIFESTINYSTADSFDKTIVVKIFNKNFTRVENNRDCLLPPGDLEVIYCDIDDISPQEHEDHIGLMQRVLNVDKAALMSLCSIGTKTLMAGEIKFEQGVEYFESESSDEEYEYISKPKLKLDESPFYEIHFQPRESKVNAFISYNRLATSERARLMLDLQITKARETAKQRLTLLIVEGLALNFDEYNFKKLLKTLENENFQTIVSIPQNLKTIIIDENEETLDLQNYEYLKNWRLCVVN